MIGAIEQAIVDRIEAASTGGTLGYRFKNVASYGNEFDDDIKNVITQFPAAWVTFGGEPRPTERGGDTWFHEPVFVVLVGQRNRRNEEAARRGAAGKPGSYQMLEDIRGLLIGQTLGLEINRVLPGRTRSVLNGAPQGAAASIYAMEFHTGYVSEQPAPAVNIGSFKTFHVDWDIPPHGNVVAPPPAAENDAEDSVILEGNP